MFGNSKRKYKLDNWVLGKLAEPFPLDEIGWLPAFGAGGAIPYVTARTVAKRLDEVVGAENWEDYYEDTTITSVSFRDITDYDGLVANNQATVRYNKASTNKEWLKSFERVEEVYGGIKCTLSVLHVSKQDAGSPSFADELKGGYSDALKRAAVKFGVGEYLSRVGTVRGNFDSRNRVWNQEPDLPDIMVPKPTKSPDEAIKALITRAKELDLDEDDVPTVKDALEDVYVMGRYFSGAPLIAKRYTYEKLMEVLEKYENQEG